MAFLKQDDVNGDGKRKRSSKKPPPPQPPPTKQEPQQHEIKYVAGLGGIEQSLDWIARGISALTGDANSVSINNGYGPALKIALAENEEDDALYDLTTALQRIADAVAMMAGLSRPRLERWHEQEEYEPQCRSSACDGGAPGPSQKTLEKVWPVKG